MKLIVKPMIYLNQKCVLKFLVVNEKVCQKFLKSMEVDDASTTV